MYGFRISEFVMHSNERISAVNVCRNMHVSCSCVS